MPIQEAQRFGVVPPELPPRSGHRALARSPRIASMPPTGLLPLPGERLLPLALMFRQSCKNVVRRLSLRRVDQVIRKTLLKKLDDVRIRCSPSTCRARSHQSSSISRHLSLASSDCTSGNLSRSIGEDITQKARSRINRTICALSCRHPLRSAFCGSSRMIAPFGFWRSNRADF